MGLIRLMEGAPARPMRRSIRTNRKAHGKSAFIPRKRGLCVPLPAHRGYICGVVCALALVIEESLVVLDASWGAAENV